MNYLSPRDSVVPHSIVNRTLELEGTVAWRNDCIVHKYGFYFWHIPQPSVHLSLFSEITKESDHFFKAFLNVLKFSLLDAQLIKPGKENETHKPVIEQEHLKQLKARGVCALSSPLLLLWNVSCQIVLFFCRRCPEGQKFQPPKVSAICGLFSILRKTDLKQAQLTSEISFCRLQVWFTVSLIFRLTDSLKLFASPRSRNVNYKLAAIQEEFWCVA